VLNAHLAAGPWTEGSGANSGRFCALPCSDLTWNDQPSAIGQAIAATCCGTAQVVTWNVTSLVQAGAANGFRVVDSQETSGGGQRVWHAREHGGGDEADAGRVLGIAPALPEGEPGSGSTS
jgi:hypothetical protein